MGVTYGFYDSVNGDRKYSADQMSALFDGLINDGVFESIGGHFFVSPVANTMQVYVAAGKAWLNHRWTYNDSVLTLTIDASDTVLDRYDRVIIEVDETTNVRANAIKILKGTASASPSLPALTNTATLHQYAIANIQIPANTSAMVEGLISNLVGMDPLPFVTGPIATFDMSTMYNQWKGQFDAWFENLQNQLDDNQAANLQNQITQLGTRVTEKVSIGDSICTSRTNFGSKWLACNGAPISSSNYPELVTILNAAHGLTCKPKNYGVDGMANQPKGEYAKCATDGTHFFVEIESSYSSPNDNSNYILYGLISSPGGGYSQTVESFFGLQATQGAPWKISSIAKLDGVFYATVTKTVSETTSYKVLSSAGTLSGPWMTIYDSTTAPTRHMYGFRKIGSYYVYDGDGFTYASDIRLVSQPSPTATVTTAGLSTTFAALLESAGYSSSFFERKCFQLIGRTGGKYIVAFEGIKDSDQKCGGFFYGDDLTASGNWKYKDTCHYKAVSHEDYKKAPELNLNKMIPSDDGIVYHMGKPGYPLKIEVASGGNDLTVTVLSSSITGSYNKHFSMDTSSNPVYAVVRNSKLYYGNITNPSTASSSPREIHIVGRSFDSPDFGTISNDMLEHYDPNSRTGSYKGYSIVTPMLWDSAASVDNAISFVAAPDLTENDMTKYIEYRLLKFDGSIAFLPEFSTGWDESTMIIRALN